MKNIRWVAVPVQTVAWTLDVNSTDGSPSLSKILALLFGVVTARDVMQRGFNVYTVTAMGLIIAAALGRSVFMNWLGRNTMTTAMTATAATSANVTLTGDLAEIAKVVTARRDYASGVEPA